MLPAWRARGKTVICVTHDDRWFDAADHVLAMRDGRFVEEPAS
jgi:putative ATP-binding cassette transporter